MPYALWLKKQNPPPERFGVEIFQRWVPATPDGNEGKLFGLGRWCPTAEGRKPSCFRKPFQSYFQYTFMHCNMDISLKSSFCSSKKRSKYISRYYIHLDYTHFDFVDFFMSSTFPRSPDSCQFLFGDVHRFGSWLIRLGYLIRTQNWSYTPGFYKMGRYDISFINGAITLYMA